MSALPNTILICFDGTWCKKDQGSNVRRIYEHTSTQVTDRRVQKHYIDGLGTEGVKDKLKGGIWGHGIDEKLWKAYSKLQLGLVKDTDNVVLVGFSRGAFTACALAVFLYDVGLHPNLQEKDFKILVKEWRKAGEAEGDMDSIHRRAGQDVSQFRRRIRTHALGLFDTVAALDGKRPRWRSPAERKKLWFVDSNVVNTADNIFQALALLERRRDFEPCIFRAPGTCQNMRQCWFTGCHADIGGDKDNKHALHHFPLLWMMNQLRDFVSFTETMLFKEILHDLKPIVRVYKGKIINEEDNKWLDSYHSTKVYMYSGPQPRTNALVSSMASLLIDTPSTTSKPQEETPSTSMSPAEPPSLTGIKTAELPLKSKIGRALRPPSSTMVDLAQQAADGTMTVVGESVTSSSTTIHWTAAMFDKWLRFSSRVNHSPLAGYQRGELESEDAPPKQYWVSTSGDNTWIWEEPIAPLEGDFITHGYGAKYGRVEAAVFYDDVGMAGFENAEDVGEEEDCDFPTREHVKERASMFDPASLDEVPEPNKYVWRTEPETGDIIPCYYGQGEFQREY